MTCGADDGAAPTFNDVLLTAAAAAAAAATAPPDLLRLSIPRPRDDMPASGGSDGVTGLCGTDAGMVGVLLLLLLFPLPGCRLFRPPLDERA